ncbi:hypothetical protein B0H17DRAFT_1219130 [Mycena rosella]|uniref:Uncharacterized protein n=1 Tax=Mycena rosella TaxID=1033263 RepID=A0AAD7BJA1_MYCRO|nr:hypothetical protein B0H17DRAFT_1219130 [Mycena rosella]
MDDPAAPYTREQGREFKRHKNLSSKSHGDSDIFLDVNQESYASLYQLLLVSLQCRDFLEVIKSDQDKKYRLTETLTKTCQDYSNVAMLSPKAKSYRNIKDSGTTIASTIVTAMRTLGIADLPPTMETGRCAVLAKVIGKALTDQRHHIKCQIFLTLAVNLEKDKEKVDIAKLTRLCIGTSSAKATAGLYQRIAFMREVAVEYKKGGGSATGKAGDDSKDDFWPVVDAKLLVLAQVTPEQRQLHFDMIYRDDLKKYGAVDNTIPVTPVKDLDAWLVSMNTAMSK